MLRLTAAEREWARYWIEEGGDPYHHREHFIAGYLAASKSNVEAEDALETVLMQAVGVGYTVAKAYFDAHPRPSVPPAVSEEGRPQQPRQESE